MRLRGLSAIGLVLACAVAVQSAEAVAPVKKVCTLVQDIKDDARETPLAIGSTGPNEPGADVIVGDFATNKTHVTGVIKVDKLVTESSTAPNGLGWIFFFNVGEHRFYLRASNSKSAGAARDFGYMENGHKRLGDATAVLDTAKNEVRITAPLQPFTSRTAIPAGKKIEKLEAWGFRHMGPGYDPGWRADVATSTRVYAAGQPSCVVVGK